MTKKLTVLMSVYNGEPYLEAAIKSILSQTFLEFDFLIQTVLNQGQLTEGQISYIPKTCFLSLKSCKQDTLFFEVLLDFIDKNFVANRALSKGT